MIGIGHAIDPLELPLIGTVANLTSSRHADERGLALGVELARNDQTVREGHGKVRSLDRILIVIPMIDHEPPNDEGVTVARRHPLGCQPTRAIGFEDSLRHTSTFTEDWGSSGIRAKKLL